MPFFDGLDHEILKSETHHRQIEQRVGKLEEARHHLFEERKELRLIVADITGANNAEVRLLLALSLILLFVSSAVAV